MPAANPFDDLFDQFRKLLNFAEEHMHMPIDEMNIPPDIDKRLKRLEKRVRMFNKLSENIVSLSGVSEEELKMRLSGVSEELPPEGKELINKSHLVKGQAEALKDQAESKLKGTNIVQESEEAEAEGPREPTRELTDEQRAKKRRSKFKRFGSDEKWKPL